LYMHLLLKMKRHCGCLLDHPQLEWMRQSMM
jgi:hypothetical protein